MENRHAAVITGYRCGSNGNLTVIYVHDDQICPYCKTKPDSGFKSWKNEWTMNHRELILDKLLIPIYPKIRLTFERMYTEYTSMLQEMPHIGFSEPIDDLKLYLSSLKEYKRYLIESTVRDKEKILIASLPRFIWIIRGYYEGKPKEDVLFDGTSVYPRVLAHHVSYT